MFEFHNQKQRYFNYQYLTSKEYLIPFIELSGPVNPGDKVLEIGCGEAGVLKAFLENGNHCTGIELVEDRVRKAKSFLAEEVESGQVKFIVKNIYDIRPDEDLDHLFDIIVLKDVIEHIPEQEKFIRVLKSFLNPGGRVFFGFPPWYMPFGGHQQLIKHRWLSKVPWFHLLPATIYKWILHAFKEPEHVIKELLSIKETGISTRRFQSILKKEGYTTLSGKWWFLNPIYKYKFGRGPVGPLPVLSSIPVIKDITHTCAYFVVKAH